MAHSMIKIDSFDHGNPKVQIVGTFNGIVLLAQWENSPTSSLILFNPFTRASEVVPTPPGRSFAYDNFYHYGLGYGTNPDDLKIVRLRSYLGPYHPSSCDVFSIKQRSWCKASKLTGNYYFYSSDTYVNGFLYWIALKLDMNSIIVALNVKEMAFSEIHIPHVFHKQIIRLGIFNGRLCMIGYTNDFELELNLMNPHVFRKSWSKVLLVRLNSLPFHVHKIQCILDTGKLRIWCSSNQLIIYDMLNDSYKEVNTLTSCGIIGTQEEAMEYVESLMSPSNMCSG